MGGLRESVFLGPLFETKPKAMSCVDTLELMGHKFIKARATKGKLIIYFKERVNDNKI